MKKEQSTLLNAVAHGGNHASSFNGGNLRNGLAPQDRAASLFPFPLSLFSTPTYRLVRNIS
jgi:hypothetical protein